MDKEYIKMCRAAKDYILQKLLEINIRIQNYLRIGWGINYGIREFHQFPTFM